MKVEDDNPRVSIVIPVYNGSNFLSEAIDSALAQTYKNIEIIVVNDGSNDGGTTERIAQSYDDRIHYYRKENGGVASALNFGIKKMTGDYFSWLSHDDLYEKTKIEDQINFIRSFQADDVIAVCNARILFESGIKKQGLIDKQTFKFFEIFLATAADVGINGCTLLIPRKALVESGGFDTTLPVTQDYDLWFRLSHIYKYRFVLLEKNLVIYRRHAEQDSVKKQQMLLEAADGLHYEILSDMNYGQFEKYLQADRANIIHTWRNYSLYKTRGYKKTASMMLKHILRYCHEHNPNKFYEIYDSEIGVDTDSEHTGAWDRKKLIIYKLHRTPTGAARKKITQEYNKLVRSGTNNYPIKASREVRGGSRPTAGIRGVARRFGESLSRDGVYLTGEKIVRKVYKNAKKRRG